LFILDGCAELHIIALSLDGEEGVLKVGVVLRGGQDDLVLWIGQRVLMRDCAAMKFFCSFWKQYNETTE
jgi:hypothetical protein